MKIYAVIAGHIGQLETRLYGLYRHRSDAEDRLTWVFKNENDYDPKWAPPKIEEWSVQ